MSEHRLDLTEVTGWIVYRLYDTQDTLLYVGQTTDLTRRLSAHRAASVFGPQIHHIVYEHTPSRRAMQDHEALLIRRLQPPHNTAGRNTQPSAPPRQPQPEHQPTQHEQAVHHYRQALLQEHNP